MATRATSPAGGIPGRPAPAVDPDGWRGSRLREGIAVWTLAFGVLMTARYAVGPFVPFVGDNLKALAIVLFLYVPAWLIWRNGETLSDYGLSLRNWRRDLAWGLGLAAVVFPLFGVGFWGFLQVMDQLPAPLPEMLSPYEGGREFKLRLPPAMFGLLVTHLLIVALPEEFFYRGWLYSRLCEGLDEPRKGRRVLGVVIGPAFWLTAVLFAVGHLTEPHFWRLGVFFPALVFAWLRLRTGGLVAPIVFHGLSNVYVGVLESSFFPS